MAQALPVPTATRLPTVARVAWAWRGAGKAPFHVGADRALHPAQVTLRLQLGGKVYSELSSSGRGAQTI